ncbi:DUF4382 domain-containing protein [Lacinutrix neustonica]|uniref:DUF4382 domain-containing protein n=1 Tax=Lacinutrix neustonica TaxID=2980107 RepID=A0A9E8MUH0_9FLAO|nr:DUF4382 domain-containing protein [Lacinutrix neustonica]WAC00897.1 DUF4382 domain-containing protein [Lacinutrix neustonica]
MKFLKYVILSLSLVFALSCNKSDDTNPVEGTSKISVRLMDMPGDFDNVFVDVQDVMIKLNDDSEGDSGWVSVEAINTGIYDLLELTGGIDVLLLDDFELPSGYLNQIRLVLGNDNTVVIDGETFPLNTPSAQQSGLKIKVNQNLEPNINYTFLLDFNVDASIVMASNSENINLKPVIRASVEAQSGYITGMVTPLDLQVLIEATNGVETISTYADETGQFVLVGLDSGAYTVTATPRYCFGI